MAVLHKIDLARVICIDVDYQFMNVADLDSHFVFLRFVILYGYIIHAMRVNVKRKINKNQK